MIRRVVAIFLACLLGLAAAAPTSASYSTGDIEGTVSHHGKSVANAAVSAAGQTVRTDDEGRFRFLPVAISGEYALTDVVVRAPGLGKWTLTDARVMPNDTLRVTADLEKRGVSIRQPKPRARSVTSLDSSYSTTAAGTYAATSYSTSTPPSTIRVYVTGSKYCNTYASGTVKVVDFKQYMKHVLPNEWMPNWHGQSLRAGAMATKSFAWHYINLGGKWPGLGADLMDSTCDQVYTPAVSYASTDRAVDDTWGYRITKNGGIHICQYWAGYAGDGAKPGGTYAGRMSQWGSQYWASNGKSWQWILAYYYDGTYLSSTSSTSTSASYGVTINARAAYTRYYSVKVSVPAPTGTTHVRLSNSSATSSGVLSEGATYAYTTSVSWSLLSSTYGGSTRNGTRVVYAQWRDSTGKWSAVKSDSIVLDTSAPSATTPLHRFQVGSSLQRGSIPVLLTWSGTDATSGIGKYQLQQSTDGGTYGWVTQAITRGHLTRQLSSGHTYRFRVRAVDRAGNVGSWRYGSSFKTGHYQETHGSVAYTGIWLKESSSVAYGGYTKYAGVAGAQARLTFTGSRIAWASPKGSSRGKAQVYVDGQLITTVDLYSSSARSSQVVYTRKWSSSGTHTIAIKVLGTSGRPRVDADAFLVLR